MRTTTAQSLLLATLLAGTVPATGQAAGEIKGGNWQFTTEMKLPAASQSAPGAQPPPAANQPMTRTACIDPAHPIPAEEQCKLESVNRNGSVVNWTMTCNSPQGPVRSVGSARYAGDTMRATLTARIPGPNGQPTDAPGTITGRYLGPCQAK
ncbi:MAG TPA: DUF3617 family protein [Stellaceae bacterium]|jgi:hypothetical protein|nr:DUF3617 family protein [Stellaceae bacterium]